MKLKIGYAGVHFGRRTSHLKTAIFYGRKNSDLALAMLQCASDDNRVDLLTVSAPGIFGFYARQCESSLLSS